MKCRKCWRDWSRFSRRCDEQNQNTKYQTPNTKKAPNPKLQGPKKLQGQNFKSFANCLGLASNPQVARVSELELGVSLVPGAWCLVFPSRTCLIAAQTNLPPRCARASPA